MLASIVADFFKYKFVQSIIILSCWSPRDQIKLIHQLSQHGIAATVTCDPSVLQNVHPYNLQGVLYIEQNNNLLEKVKPEHFSYRYKWLLVSQSLPTLVHQVRYDALLTHLQADIMENNIIATTNETRTINLEDIYVHPSEGASLHPWAYWTQSNGLIVTHDKARIQRRNNLKRYPLRIVCPVGQYSEDWYNGSFADYVQDESLKQLDSTIRCGYETSRLVIDALNATDDLMNVDLWGSVFHNSSVMLKLWYGEADLSGGILRLLPYRMSYMDYVMPIWPFSVGFTYLAERESSSNMFVEPFTAGVWIACLVIGFILAIAQRVTSRSQKEKDGAYYAVLATWLQQDASAVPDGLAGRWAFIVLSICAMLVHAYYTSAIVSALMSSGRSGPDSLRTLADSRYAIASEDYEYMRNLMFDVTTNWDDLEYLKKKKMTSAFYQELEHGVELIKEGNTAFHAEYNQIFPHFRKLSDDQICKVQYVDTIPEVMAWVTTTKYGQWTNSFRSVSSWIHEVGLAKRVQSRLLSFQPPCRTALLAERVNFGDVAPLISLSVLGVLLSLILLGFEIIFDRWKNGRIGMKTIVSDIEQ